MRWARTHPRSGPVREGGRDFKSRRPDELTRWARAVWLLEQVPLPEVGTISGDILKAPGFLKGPAGPLSRAPRPGMRGFLPAGLCPAIAPIESSAMQKPTRSVGSEIHGPGTGAIRRAANLPPPLAGQKGTYPGSANLSRQPQSHPRVPTTLESVLQPWRSVGVRLASQFSCSASHWSHAAWLRMAVPVS